jgi:Ca2+:H+ antiporter
MTAASATVRRAPLAWPATLPIGALLVLGSALALDVGVGLTLGTVAAFAMVGAVIAAVHHAEVIAHRIGEPFGTLVLALAVTVIEASLILSIMIAGGEDQAELARDTMFAALMIILNGVVGLCVLVGAIRHREQTFRIEGANQGLAALAALATLVLVLPTYTVSTPSGTYSTSQLAFAAVASFTLWGVWVFVQTVRHRDYFLPPPGSEDSAHAVPPSTAQAWASLCLLLVSLVAVVGLAKVLSPAIEYGVDAIGAPRAVIGIVIAMIVLMPETSAALRAARANRLQTSMNLAIGSALATIGLTIPVVVIAAIVLRQPLVLGIDAADSVMLALTFVVSSITLASGRMHVMQGAVHVVLFAAFLFLSLVP